MLYVWAKADSPAQMDALFRPLISGSGIPTTFIEAHLPPPVLTDKDVLLAMGGTQLTVLKTMGVVKKNNTITALRGQAWKFGEGRVFISYSPSMMELDVGGKPQIIWDIQLAKRYHQTGSLLPDLSQCDYRWVDNFNEVVAQVDAAHAEGRTLPLSLDLETVGLDPWAPEGKIVSIQMTTRVQQGLAYYCKGGVSPAVAKQVKWLCQSPSVRTIGANLKYDMVWIKQHLKFDVTNYWFDTFLAGSLDDENISNSLNLQAKMYTDIGGYDDELVNKYDKSRMDLIPKEDLLPYACGDVDAALRMYYVFRQRIGASPRVTRFYKHLLHPVSKTFVHLEHRGICVDLKQYGEVEFQVGQGMKEAEAKCLSLMPRMLKIKYHDDLSITRPALIRDLMFSKLGYNLKPQMWTAGGEDGTKEKHPSTAADHLALFADHPEAKEFVDALSEFTSAKKTMSTYVVGFLKHLRSDGKFHPTYFLAHGGELGDEAGTVSGRTSCKRPAYQTQPKHTKWAMLLRTVYVPPPGFVILKDDYDQGELRVCACVTGDEAMITAYRAGIDLHLKTGCAMKHLELEEGMAMLQSNKPSVVKMIKAIRQGGKVGNFGLIYRISPAGLVAYAWSTYGVRMTEEEAFQFKQAFFELYPGIAYWQEAIVKEARRFQQVSGPLGRVRHLPFINSKNSQLRSQSERQAINNPIQGTLSDMKTFGMSELSRVYPDLWQWGFTHDETQYYVPEADWEVWAKRIRDVNENLPLHIFGWRPQLAFPVEVQMSASNLAECKKVQLA